MVASGLDRLSRDYYTYGWRLFYAGVACSAPCIAGLSMAFTSPALSTMKGKATDVSGEPLAVPASLVVFDSELAASCFSSFVNIGALAGAAAGGTCYTKFGKLATLRAALFALCGAWACSAVTTSVWLLFFARLVTGLGVGLQSVAAPSFLTDVAPPKLRGSLGTLNTFAVLLGVAGIFFLGGLVFRQGFGGEFCDWRGLAALISAVSACALLLTLALPEPPPAITRLDSLRSLMQESAATRKADRRRAMSGTIPLFWQQLAGINIIIFFGQGVLESTGIAHSNSLGVTVITVQIVGVAVAAALIDRVGRRPLLLCSIGGMGIAAALFAAAVAASIPPGAARVVGIVGPLCMYVFCFALGMGPVPWILLTELGLPSKLRSKVASFATAGNWTASFLITGPLLLAMERACGVAGVFLLCSGMCVLGFLLILLFLPETAEHSDGPQSGGLEPLLSPVAAGWWSPKKTGETWEEPEKLPASGG